MNICRRHRAFPTSTKYRPADELEAWRKRDPITRFHKFLLDRQMLTEPEAADIQAAIDDPDPVLFLEHMKLYRSSRQAVPTDYYTVPLGQAAVVREGRDLSLFAYGAMVAVAGQAAELVEAEQAVSIEVIDLHAAIREMLAQGRLDLRQLEV